MASTSPSASRTSRTCAPCSSTSTCAGRRWRATSGCARRSRWRACCRAPARSPRASCATATTSRIGTNAQSVRDSGAPDEPGDRQGVAAIRRAFQPDVIIYDLPPMLMSDDVMAFLPHLDCVLLVAARREEPARRGRQVRAGSRRADQRARRGPEQVPLHRATTTATEAAPRGVGAPVTDHVL